MEPNPKEMLALIYSMFALPSVCGDHQVAVVCPFCQPERPYGMSYVHLVSARTYPGSDNPAAAHHPDTGVPGDTTVLRFSCEIGGNSWALVFGGEKGESKVHRVPVADSPSEDELPANVVRFTRRDV